MHSEFTPVPSKKFESVSPLEADQCRKAFEEFIYLNRNIQTEDYSVEGMVSNMTHAVSLLKGGAKMFAYEHKKEDGSVTTLILPSQSNFIFIDMQNGKPVGCTTLESERHGDNLFYVSWTGTLPQSQKQGFSTERLRRIREYAHAHGFKVTSGRSFESEHARAAWDRLVSESLAIKAPDSDHYSFV